MSLSPAKPQKLRAPSLRLFTGLRVGQQVRHTVHLTPENPEPTLELMELNLQPELATKLEQLSAETGRPPGEFVEEALTGYFTELEQVRTMLDRRYDEMISGQIEPIDGEEAVRLIKERAAARRKSIV